jgi:hypothetical protein
MSHHLELTAFPQKAKKITKEDVCIPCSVNTTIVRMQGDEGAGRRAAAATYSVPPAHASSRVLGLEVSNEPAIPRVPSERVHAQVDTARTPCSRAAHLM